MSNSLHAYQLRAINFILEKETCALFLDAGLGKTVITLTAIRKLIDEKKVNSILIVAPKRVVTDVWALEVDKWAHLKDLTYSLIIGNEEKRLQAIQANAQIYLISRDNIAWYAKQKARAHDMLVLDELTSFKTNGSLRFKAIKEFRKKIKRVVGLTATPMANSELDLWGQMYCIDEGARLEKKISHYRSLYFDEKNKGSFSTWILKVGGDLLGDNFYKKAIADRISDITMRMDAKDFLDMPTLIINDRHVVLSEKDFKVYKNFQRDKILEFKETGEVINAVNAAVLAGKLQQVANGAVYVNEKDYEEIHFAKIDAIKEIIEAENGGVLIFYAYKHDRYRLLKGLNDFSPIDIKDKDAINIWNEGKARVLLAHPDSAGHGLNLQQGGRHVVFFSPLYSAEKYTQCIARLYRQGQTSSVVVTRMVTRSTIDEKIINVLEKKTTLEKEMFSLINSE